MNKQRRKARPRKTRPPRKVRERRTLIEACARLDRSAVLLLIFLYCVLHWGIRVLLGGNFTSGEATQLLMSQSLQLGYDAREAPLLAWLYAAADLWPGLSAPVVYAIKYALLWVALVFYYLAARNVLVKPAVSAGALAAWALTWLAGWSLHQDLLASVALMAVLSLALHALTRILAWRRNRDWIYFGAACGLGLLTHHLFVVFPVAMIAAIVMSAFFREVMRPARLIMAGVVAAAIYAPYAWWLFTHGDSIARSAQEFAETWETDPDWLLRVRDGAVSLGRSLVEFTLPLSLFWAMLFWPLWLPILYPVFARRSTDEEPHEEAQRKLLARAMMIGAALYLTGVIIGVADFRSQWMLPVLYTAPIWMFMHVKRAGEFPVGIRAFAAMAILFVVAAAGGRVAMWHLQINLCTDGETCRAYTPVRAWADELAKAGFNGGTIVGADEHLTGNLRAAFPRARVMDAALAPSSFPAASTYGACLAVWRDYTVMPDALADYLENDLRAPPRDRGPEGAIRRNLLLSDGKAATLYFQFVPPSGACR